LSKIKAESVASLCVANSTIGAEFGKQRSDFGIPNLEYLMNDLMNKTLLCGLGLASLTKDSIEKSVDDLLKRAKISEEEGRKLAKDLLRRSNRAREALEKQVDPAAHEALQHLNVPKIISGRLKEATPAQTRSKTNRRPKAGTKTSNRKR
jgi:polyhydroxyalkanoate synthesis regulator phasin